MASRLSRFNGRGPRTAPEPDRGAPHEANRAFLARLRRAREDAGLTQVQVAKQLGRPQTWVSKCELGERRVDFVELEDLAATYGKQLDWFGTRR
jgi:ribosome-binding protein aMBF1 (putative translation factor)